MLDIIDLKTRNIVGNANDIETALEVIKDLFNETGRPYTYGERDYDP